MQDMMHHAVTPIAREARPASVCRVLPLDFKGLSAAKVSGLARETRLISSHQSRTAGASLAAPTRKAGRQLRPSCCRFNSTPAASKCRRERPISRRLRRRAIWRLWCGLELAVSSAMPDRISPARRSANMSRIRSKDTRPEMIVRRMLHRLGYRFRLHARDLPGKPDIVFRRRAKAIQVYGCFWHRHTGCQDCSVPGSRQEYWVPKFAATVARDGKNLAEMRALGWDVLILWECETRDPLDLETRLGIFLGAPVAGDRVQTG